MSFPALANPPAHTAAAFAAGLPLPPGPAPTTPPAGGLPLEEAWRRVSAMSNSARGVPMVIASRWIDEASGHRRAEAETPADRHVLSVALRRTRVRLTSDRHEIFDGVMASGTVHLTGPSRRIQAEFQGPCDFLHLYVDDGCVAARGEGRCGGGPADLDGIVLHEPFAWQLARTVTEDAHAGDPVYAESVARMLLLRIAALSARHPMAVGLPKWRLRRAEAYLQEHIDEAISLADLACAAGLSRSYFAAQFRAATGFRPHEYVTEQRIDRAKELLAEGVVSIVEVALAVGFQTQAHFSTVFKRLTGGTPARWRMAHLRRE